MQTTVLLLTGYAAFRFYERPETGLFWTLVALFVAVMWTASAVKNAAKDAGILKGNRMIPGALAIAENADVIRFWIKANMGATFIGFAVSVYALAVSFGVL